MMVIPHVRFQQLVHLHTTNQNQVMGGLVYQKFLNQAHKNIASILKSMDT